MTFWTCFEPAEESECFLRGPLECVTEAKNLRVNYIFDLRSHVISKCGNGSEEIAGRWQNNSLCQTDVRVLHVKFWIEKHCLVKHFCFLEKRLLSIFKFCASRNFFFFMSCWLAHNQPSRNVLLFWCYPIGQLCLSGLGYSSHTVTRKKLFWICEKHLKNAALISV